MEEESPLSEEIMVISEKIDKIIKKVLGQDASFALLVFERSDSVSYASNTENVLVRLAMEGFLEDWHAAQNEYATLTRH